MIFLIIPAVPALDKPQPKSASVLGQAERSGEKQEGAANGNKPLENSCDGRDKFHNGYLGIPLLLSGEECLKLDACCRRRGLIQPREYLFRPWRGLPPEVRALRLKLRKLREIIELEHLYCGEENW